MKFKKIILWLRIKILKLEILNIKSIMRLEPPTYYDYDIRRQSYWENEIIEIEKEIIKIKECILEPQQKEFTKREAEEILKNYKEQKNSKGGKNDNL